MARGSNKYGGKRRGASLPKKADFATEEEFLRLRPGRRRGDNLVKNQLIGKLGSRGYGRLLDKLRKLAPEVQS